MRYTLQFKKWVWSWFLIEKEKKMCEIFFSLFLASIRSSLFYFKLKYFVSLHVEWHELTKVLDQNISGICAMCNVLVYNLPEITSTNFNEFWWQVFQTKMFWPLLVTLFLSFFYILFSSLSLPFLFVFLCYVNWTFQHLSSSCFPTVSCIKRSGSSNTRVEMSLPLP